MELKSLRMCYHAESVAEIVVPEEKCIISIDGDKHTMTAVEVHVSKIYEFNNDETEYSVEALLQPVDEEEK